LFCRKALLTHAFIILILLLGALVLAGCGGGSVSQTLPPPITPPTPPEPPTPPQPPPPAVNPLVVNSGEDTAQPAAGTVTLRSALSHAGSSDTITFDPALDGKTINLTIVSENHTVLKGEVYSGMTFKGYAERDYGKSALYAHKSVKIDASNLPNGITINWAGGDANPARVLAVYGNLTLRKVNVTGGFSKAEAIDNTAQPYTLARGGGIAVWGTADLANCAVSGNRIAGDENSSRDRGTYGGGIYSNGLVINNCVISGNMAIGYGAAGGGIYSVGGADNVFGVGNDTYITNSAISGNKITAQHAYGGGVFTLSGGPSNLAVMHITNCTIARNLVEDHPGIPDEAQAQFYFRGGGIYMGGGGLEVVSSTITQNEVNGEAKDISNKPNMGGGGIAATIGNAHVVEDLVLRHSIVVGNKMNGVAQDIFTGSLLNFTSGGYNLIGALDFSQILVPIPDAMGLSRKHYPKVGDLDGVVPSDVLSLESPHLHDSIISAGTDAGQNAVLWYLPNGSAVNQIPHSSYQVSLVSGGYTGWATQTDDFLNTVVTRLRTDYSSQLGSDFGTDLGDLTGTTFYGPAQTWPSNSQNAPWIAFWRNLDARIGNTLGTVILADDFWGTFTSGPVGNVNLTIKNANKAVQLNTTDQRGQPRTFTTLGDIGAIEK
jgi:hypothetical protein